MVDSARVGLDGKLYNGVSRCSICYDRRKATISCCFLLYVPLHRPLAMKCNATRGEN